MDLMILKRDEETFLNAVMERPDETLPDVIEDILPILAFTHLKAQTFRDLVNRTSKIKDQKRRPGHGHDRQG